MVRSGPFFKKYGIKDIASLPDDAYKRFNNAQHHDAQHHNALSSNEAMNEALRLLHKIEIDQLRKNSSGWLEKFQQASNQEEGFEFFYHQYYQKQ